MEYFEKKKVITGGTKSNPYYEEIGDYKCIKCKVKAKLIKEEDASSRRATNGRGILITTWTESTYQCPKCKKKETYDHLYGEEDGSYYSNEERRAYGM